MSIQLSLATTNGSLHSTNKSAIVNILTKQVQTPADVTLAKPGCLLIDGQALVMALEKLPDMTIFGEIAHDFQHGAQDGHKIREG